MEKRKKNVVCRESLEIIIKLLSRILPITVFNFYSYPYLQMLKDNGLKLSTYFILRKSSEFFWSILFLASNFHNMQATSYYSY